MAGQRRRHHYLGMVAWHRGRSRARRAHDARIDRGGSGDCGFPQQSRLLCGIPEPGRPIACFRRTLEVDPLMDRGVQQPRAHARSQPGVQRAVAAYREAIAHEPRFAVARQNLAVRSSPWAGRRRVGTISLGVSCPRASRRIRPMNARRACPMDLHGRRIALLSEQGLGDVLFFPALCTGACEARRAARVSRKTPRLQPLLERTGLFALGIAEGQCARSECESISWGPAVLSQPTTRRPFPRRWRCTRCRSRRPSARTLRGVGCAAYVALTLACRHLGSGSVCARN